MNKHRFSAGGFLKLACVMMVFAGSLSATVPIVFAGKTGPQISFHRLPVDGALTQNTVVDMLQDRRGLMWFATLGGLDVYDGYTFRTIPSDPRQGNSLAGVQVSRIYEDRSGSLWVAGFRGWLNRIAPGSGQIHRYAPELYGGPGNPISGPTAFHETADGELLIGTVTGLHRYDPGTDRFVRGIDKQEGHPDIGGIRDAISDRDGWLWIASTRGVFRYHPSTGSHQHFRYDPDDPGSLPDSPVSRLLLDSRDRLWLGTVSGGLARLDPGASEFRVFRADESAANAIASDQIVDLMEDSRGRIWIANQSGGLSRFVSDQSGFEVHRHEPNDPETISANDVWSLLEDRTGLIWIGTAGGGLNQINPSRSRFETLRTVAFNENSLRSSFVWDLLEDDDGRIWMATLAGVESYSPDERLFRHFAPAPGSVSANQMQSVAMDTQGRLWAGSVNGGLFRLDPADGEFTEVLRQGGPSDAFDSGRIWTLYADGDRMWAGTGTGLYAISIDSFDIVDVLASSDAIPMRADPIRSMLPDPDGGYWIGSAGAGLARFVPGQGIIKHFRHERRNPYSLSNDVVRSLHMSSNGDLWVGTLNGLNHISHSDIEAGRNHFSLYTVADGLPNNTVYGIVADTHDHLWLSTNKGLSRFSPDTGEFENFDVADGLPANELNGGAELRASDGRMYFGGVAGVSIIDSDGLSRNETVPDIVITGVSLGGEPLSTESVLGDVLRIPFGASDIGIEFALADYHQPEKNAFQYRLDGAFNEWRETTQRQLSFSRLAAGTYRFDVRGSNNDGVWSEESASVAFRVLPPPWRTTTAYVLYGALLLLGLIGYHQLQRRRLARERAFSEELKRAHSLAEANHQMALRYAQFDQLTQLPNRAALIEALARYMRHAVKGGRDLAVLLINLDRFQRINDSFGHAIGDRVLKTIAARLELMVAGDDYLARIGPDEFVWLALIDPPDSIDRWAQNRAAEIGQIIGRPFDFQEPPVVMTASIGCAVYRHGPESASEVLGYADIALHQAKQDEHPRVRCYEPAMSESAHHHITIEARLKRALETDELSAHYQPLVAIPGGELKALEALIRWNPVGGDPIYPDQFIPIAEQSDLIVEIGNWMIRHVCRQLALWRNYEPKGIQVAINVSMRQLRSATLVATLRDALNETGVPASALKVEITESAMMENVEDTAEQLMEVSQLGIEISVDDFGTGFSSLSHLKMLPVNELKIDRSFITDIASSAESRTIVMSIVRLAHELNLRVVVEGVEDGQALDWLAEIGCDIAQGYFFARPLAPAELIAGNWIRFARGHVSAHD